MIEVRLYANLASAAGVSGRRSAGAPSATLRVEPRPGLTVDDVVREAGVRAQDIFVVMVNGAVAALDSPLADGDRVGLFPPISGG
jgi:molybdopterin converting factor small subunit